MSDKGGLYELVTSAHAAGDTDWYRVHVVDSWAIAHAIRISAIDTPEMGDDFEVAAWFACDSGTGTATCEGSTQVTDTFGPGCTQKAGTMPMELIANCPGLNDSGTLLVRVTNPTWDGNCDDYRFSIVTY